MTEYGCRSDERKNECFDFSIHWAEEASNR